MACLEDKKAQDIVFLDLTGKNALADCFIIASGTSTRQNHTIAQAVKDTLKQHHIPCHIEGLEVGDWVLIDAGHIIIHLFRPEIRQYYDLESMWLEVATHRAAQSS